MCYVGNLSKDIRKNSNGFKIDFQNLFCCRNVSFVIMGLFKNGLAFTHSSFFGLYLPLSLYLYFLLSPFLSNSRSLLSFFLSYNFSSHDTFLLFFFIYETYFFQFISFHLLFIWFFFILSFISGFLSFFPSFAGPNKVSWYYYTFKGLVLVPD